MEKEIITDLHNRGFNVMPAKLGTKMPMVGEWLSLQNKKYDGEFPNSCNAAIICGAISDNLFVLDLDEASIYDDFREYHGKTFTVQSGKGYHLYFRTDGFLPPNANGVEDSRGRTLEIQVEGKYVMSPGSFVVPDEKSKHKYPISKQNGFYYKIICDKPVMTINPGIIKEKLDSLGFVTTRSKMADIKNGVKEGSRDNDVFKYTCYLVREFGLSGETLLKAVEDQNKKNKPPLYDSDLTRIINRALSYEGKNVERVDDIISKIIASDEPMEISMQDITPILEGVPVKFHATVTAVGERYTITKEANFICGDGHDNPTVCDSFHNIKIPIVCDDPGCKQRDFDIDRDSLKTEYVQLMRIEEFLEESRNSTPVEFDAEIIGDKIGEAYAGQRKNFTAKFRSIITEKKGQHNNIVFEIVEMEDTEQGTGCLPEPEEVDTWREIDIFNKVCISVAPELLFNNNIKKSIMFSIAGGTGLNGKRSNIHVALPGDAQLGKSEILEAFHKLTPGSGFALGGSLSGPGLTIGMVKLFNGTMVPKPGLLPRHTGYPVYFDEGDKMSDKDMESLFECMEQQTVTNNKVGANGLRLPAINQIIFAGNPKNGKYNHNISIMDNFNMSEPFITRFDIIWLLIDKNSADLDAKIRKHIRDFKRNEGSYLKTDELQRYFTYIKTLSPTLPEELETKLDDIHKKMRRLNTKQDGLNMGWRQYYGLHRLVTACAACHLRDTVTQEDIDIVYSIIKESLNSLKMDIEGGGNQSTFLTTSQSKEKLFLEIWNAMMDDNFEVDKDDFITELGKHHPFTGLTAEIEFSKRSDRMILNNNSGKYKIG